MGRNCCNGGPWVQLLGGFQVARDGRILIERSWPRRKAMALVKLLALQPSRSMHREAVFDTLWPNLSPAAAANNLRLNLFYLRGALGESCHRPSIVSVVGPGVELSPAAEIDIDHFRRAGAHARTVRADPSLYEAALTLYSGDLLPDDPYEVWTLRPRERLSMLRIELLVELSMLYAERGDVRNSTSRLNDVLSVEPAHEYAHRALMHLYSESGDRHRALRQYEACRNTLETELGVKPSEETTAAYHDIVLGGRVALSTAASLGHRRRSISRPEAARRAVTS